eukprot:PhM_4_TR15245/c0_g1_i1/m.59380
MPSQPTTVKALMPYTKQEYKLNGLKVQNREHEVSGSIDLQQVELHDIRASDDVPQLHREGFVLVNHPVAEIVPNWLDEEQNEHNKVAYATATAEMLMGLTGCSRVAVFDMDMRMSRSELRESLSTFADISFTKPLPGTPLGLVITGSRVRSVAEGSVADAAGLRPGMTICRVNGAAVDNFKGAVQEALSRIEPGTNVTMVVMFGFTGASGKGVRDPAGAVHWDFSPLFELEATAPKHPPCCLTHTARPENKHFMIVNVWRSMDHEHVVKRDPLAFCDMRTVDEHDMIHAEYHGVPFVRLAASDEHRWLYASDMTSSEAIVHLQYDTRVEELTRRAVFHSSCVLESQQDNDADPPRQSVEARCFLYFDEDDKTKERIERYVAHFKNVCPTPCN